MAAAGRKRPLRRPARPWLGQALRLVGEFQPSGGLQGAGVEGADFGGSADVQGDDQAVAGDPCGHDFGAPRQGGGQVGGGATSLALEKAVADGDEHRRDADAGGQPSDQHHAADFCRHQRGLFRIRVGHGVGHAAPSSRFGDG